MFTKDSFFFNYCGIDHGKPSVLEYKEKLIREECIKLNKCTEVSNNRHHHK